MSQIMQQFCLYLTGLVLTTVEEPQGIDGVTHGEIPEGIHTAEIIEEGIVAGIEEGIVGTRKSALEKQNVARVEPGTGKSGGNTPILYLLLMVHWSLFVSLLICLFVYANY